MGEGSAAVVSASITEAHAAVLWVAAQVDKRVVHKLDMSMQEGGRQRLVTDMMESACVAVIKVRASRPRVSASHPATNTTGRSHCH